MTRWHHRCGSHGSGAARRADPRMKSSRARSGGSRTSDILRIDVAGPARKISRTTTTVTPHAIQADTGKWNLGGVAAAILPAQVHCAGVATHMAHDRKSKDA